MAADLVITDALILDGTGAPGRPGDVLVEGDRIVEIAPPGSGRAAQRRLSATGRVVAPGFIDLHAHSIWRSWPTMIIWPRSAKG